MLSMLTPSVSTPQYHDALLIVKIRPAAGPLPGAAAFSPAPDIATTPGLAALAAFERAGLIKEVIPLGRLPAIPSLSPMAVLATVAGPTPPGVKESSALAGTSLIRLEAGTDTQQIQVALAQDPYIEAVSRVPIRYLMAKKQAARPGRATPAATPPLARSMWNLKKIRWKEAVDGGLDLASDIHVAVLDTGIDLGHPDLPGGEITYMYEYPNSLAVTTDQDVVGHGTHVAGTIRAIINNEVGINGICACKLSAYKIFSDQPEYLPPPFGGYFAYLVDPILYRTALATCLDAGVQVINLSIGGYGTPDVVEKQLFQELMDGGVAVVAAMGNENTSQKSYPAAIPGVIAVGATKLNDIRANFSNYGPHMALCAPGVGIWSTLPTYQGQTGFFPAPGSGNPPQPGQPISRETDYDAWDGTSMAAPHVAAAAALALAKHGPLSPQALKDRLMKAVDKVAGMQGQAFSNFYGAGRLNLMKL